MVSEVTVSKGSQVKFPPKASIKCVSTAKYKYMLHEKPALIFTHGSGGDLSAAAMVNFATGFANVSPILCFQGNLNLASRTKMFKAVCEDQGSAKCLGGRSMGARAAVMAATQDTTHLVLVSYPLHTEKVSRDQILLDLPASVKVLFVSGDRDAMCELGRLEVVRKKMKCKTWLVAVNEADHGMSIKPKSENGTTSVGMVTGEVVARWLGGFDKGVKEAIISWQSKDERVQWCGWEVGVKFGSKSGLGHPEPEAAMLPTATTFEDDKEEDGKNEQLDSMERGKKRSKPNERSISKRSAKKAKR